MYDNSLTKKHVFLALEICGFITLLVTIASLVMALVYTAHITRGLREGPYNNVPTGVPTAVL